ncbi:restriction endonuclease subunit S [Paeniglutamicibacter gangotriensis]|uniref:Restriction endonuclease subunit S n=1 Tax=Paeniglutamicibacter gangotriensis TaxID=254787 RepID=A0A5B0E5I3_9MICC|nr:restriction endonuclease subunit S [Paeniglutamicibacter gangotriensis]KAA0973020.1 restriction endonuclease subunit S [Paeniglutamicibacter gangotriensis]
MIRTRGFSNYEETGLKWLGPVPSAWGIVPLWTLYTRGKSTNVPDEELLSVYRDHGVVLKSSRADNFNKPSDDLSPYQLVKPGDMVINKMKAWQGSVAISRHRGIVSPAYFVYERHHSMDDRYLHYLLRSERYIAGYLSLSKGIRINQWDLDPTYHSRMPVLVPSIQEQRNIVNILDRETAQIDVLITKQERLIELLAEKRQAIITRAVTKGLDPTAPTKPSGIPWLGDIPSRWEAIPLKWLSQFTTGITPSTANEDNFPEEETSYPWIRPEDLEESGRPTEASKFLSAEAWNGCRPVRADSVLLCCIGGTLGKVGLIRRSAVTNQQITAIETEMVGAYLFATLGAARQEIKAMSVGNTLPILNTSRLGMLSVPVPPAQEQLKIAEYVRVKSLEIDLLSSKCHSAIRLLRERRSALISAAVTGKIDAREGVA